MSMTFENAATKSADVNGTNFVFREIGKKGGVPVVLLHHLTAVLEDWDPRVVDGLAAKHHVIAFDNRGVGGSGGSAPKTVEEMAQDAVAFIGALGFSKVDLFGFLAWRFRLSGHRATTTWSGAQNHSRGHRPGGRRRHRQCRCRSAGRVWQGRRHQQASEAFSVLYTDEQRPGSADDFLRPLKERTKDLDAPVRNETFRLSLRRSKPGDRVMPPTLGTVQHPVLVVNGDDDVMVPSFNSFELARRLPNAQLSIFPDAGHGGIFQHHAAFVQQALAFLQQ
jgi:Predicted hydrolases or acyltransferases (alpha/beta hydrolase superfamily)